MFIMKGNLRNATPCAGSSDVKLLKRVGTKGILKLENANAILSRLCNSDYIKEGSY